MICKYCGTEYSGESALGTLGHNKGECRDALVSQLAAERERREAAERDNERDRLTLIHGCDCSADDACLFARQRDAALAAQKAAEERAEVLLEQAARIAEDYSEETGDTMEERVGGRIAERIRALAPQAPPPSRKEVASDPHH